MITLEKNKKSRSSVMPYVDGEAYTKYFSGVYDFLTQLSGWRTKIAQHALDGFVPCKILDVGCGTGYLLSLAQKKNFEISGVDPSSGMLEKAVQKYGLPKEKLFQSKADHLPFLDKTFDLVIASGSLMYTPNLQETAREMVRVAKIGGCVRVFDHARPKKKNFFTPFVFLFSQFSGQILHDYEHYFSPYCKLIQQKTLGRGGYLQKFDFLREF